MTGKQAFKHFDSPSTSSGQAAQCDIRVLATFVFLIYMLSAIYNVMLNLHSKKFEHNTEMTGINSNLIHFQKIRKHFSTFQ